MSGSWLGCCLSLAEWSVDTFLWGITYAKGLIGRRSWKRKAQWCLGILVKKLVVYAKIKCECASHLSFSHPICPFLRHIRKYLLHEEALLQSLKRCPSFVHGELTASVAIPLSLSFFLCLFFLCPSFFSFTLLSFFLYLCQKQWGSRQLRNKPLNLPANVDLAFLQISYSISALSLGMCMFASFKTRIKTAHGDF